MSLYIIIKINKKIIIYNMRYRECYAEFGKSKPILCNKLSRSKIIHFEQ